ncbi:hypothetical protein ONE63_004081 [Megalurothrips usitatus]|uniref:Uncharacterized protein n=1 Tax=Megalurothrips usitatus TaxID=439358 RepID=A0AAV7X1Q6_9NEOP|nr:hypothetical protein ONE63_004081 [Megalurothrips usitatus]
MSSAVSTSSLASIESSAGSERSGRSMPPPSKLPGLVKATVAKPSGIRPPSAGGSSTSSGVSSAASAASKVGRLCDGHPKKDPTPSPATPTQSKSRYRP